MHPQLWIVIGLVASVTARATSSLHARSHIDTCGDVDDILAVPGLSGTKVSIGQLKKCICQSQIPVLLASDPLVLTAVPLVGEVTVKNELVSMLAKAKGRQDCVYPDNAEPVCENGAPCRFTCTNGFTAFPSEKKPTDCVCKWPLTVCNGICGSFAACPSSAPQRRDTLRKRPLCSPGRMACGIYGRPRALSDAWECLDTSTDLESCGGCATPLDARSPHGVDCTAIPGVLDVACRAGFCDVRRCAPGYSISEDRTFCIASGAILEQNVASRL